MTNNLSNLPIDHAFNIAEELSLALVENGRTTAEKDDLAVTLDSFVRTIVKRSETDDGEHGQAYGERVDFICTNALAALADMIALDQDYSLADLDARLWVVRLILEMLETLVSSSLVTGRAIERLSDELHGHLSPLLCLVVRLMDPDKFEFGYVPDAWVQSGARAMNAASQLSRIITRADDKEKEARKMGDLAA